MTTEIVMSPVKDENFKTHLNDSPVWKNCEHAEDVVGKDLTGWFEYKVKFEGLVPVQCTKMKKIK